MSSLVSLDLSPDCVTLRSYVTSSYLKSSICKMKAVLVLVCW